MDNIGEKIEIINRIVKRLEVYLNGLQDNEWSVPSQCDLWEVGDVVSHLAGGAKRQSDSMVKGRQGIAEAPQSFSNPDASTMSTGNARRDIEQRKNLGNNLFSAYVDNHTELYELLKSFSEEEWDTPCWHARRGAIPAKDYVDLRLQELVIHDWDIRASIGSDVNLDEEGSLALLSVAQTWLSMTFRPGSEVPRNLCFRFLVDQQPTYSHDVISNGSTFKITPVSSTEPQITINCDRHSYLLLVYGRILASNKQIVSQMNTQGDDSVLQYFEEWFKGL